jgi:hypothetical protein
MARKKILILIGFFLIILITFLSISNIKHNLQSNQNLFHNDQPGISRDTNFISFGLYDPNGKIINNGSILSPLDNKLNKILSISHNINEEREYSLIILENFSQSKFAVSGKEYLTYDFIMKPNSKFHFEIQLDVPQDTKEVDCLIIKKPKYLLKDNDVTKASILQEVLPLRFKIASSKNQEPNKLNYEKPLQTFYQGPNDCVFISESIDKLKIMYRLKQNKTAYLSVGNIKNKNVDYALVAFLDWKQVPVLNNKEVIYVSVPKGVRKVFPLSLMNTEKEKNYQVLALPKPYQASPTDNSSQTVYGSMRTIIEP